ncbi:MAG TPA: metalloregulator ArsR/SmtB family transcription factor [Magnetospirillaceae bacterium]|nr:metalloregulator ArsR/SmtB family transcription factor [Magnetospirillaceae bacterium]
MPLEGIMQGAIDRKRAIKLAGVTKAISDPVRMRIISLLAQADRRGMRVFEMQTAIGLSQPTTSHHLKLLKEAGMVKRQRVGRAVTYRLDAGALAALFKTITAAATKNK